MKPVCMITGAAGRLGRALCVALRDEYNVVGTYHAKLPTVNSQLRQRMGSTGEPVYLIQADLTRRHDLQRVVEVAMARHNRIDVLINCAADIKFHGNLRDLWQASDYAQSQMLTNAVVPMQLASAIYHHCWKDQANDPLLYNRSIVNVSSVSGNYVRGGQGQAFYGASKAALNMLTLYLSLELAPYGVRVNAVCPSRFTSAPQTRRVTAAIRQLIENDSTGKLVSGIP